MLLDVVNLGLVVAFGLVNGVNDGGTIAGLGLRVGMFAPWLPLAVLVVMLAVVPAVFGTRVAETLTLRLVGFEGRGGSFALFSAVVATLLVVWFLASRGLPTSLTLGLVGAMAGAGFAAGLSVDWSGLGFVLAIAALAPLVGLIGGFVLHRVIGLALGATPRFRRVMPGAGYVLQCVAYGANDGQKLLAVLAVALAAPPSFPGVPWSLWLVTVAAFAVGAAIGVARIGPTVSDRVFAVRPHESTAAQFSSGMAVIGSAALGGPVSLTQATTGGLVGAGVSVTHHRVRWEAVSRIGLAWVVTLPASILAAALLSGAGRLVT